MAGGQQPADEFCAHSPGSQPPESAVAALVRHLITCPTVTIVCTIERGVIIA
jgi:hypothetical protein